ncbi:MAG: SHOCT domain-containing protein [Pseudomonadota bacterium]
MKQKQNKQKQWGEIAKNFFSAYVILILILALNIAVLFILGIIVIFFKGVVDYMVWILLGGLAIMGISSYMFWRRMKKSGKTFREMMKDPLFQGRSVEVNLLGGLFSVKMGRPTRPLSIEDLPSSRPQQLEDPKTSRARELAHLATLLEKNLITQQEFLQAKEDLMRPSE